MFIGENEMILNQATMKAVVQFWLNAAMTKPPKVISVLRSINSIGSSEEFLVTVEDESKVTEIKA